MQTSHRIWLAGCLVIPMAVLVPVSARSSFPQTQVPNSANVTVVNAGAGSCTADFAVRDSAGKGLYDAKIDIQIKYGFMGLHKVNATVGTNADGKARIEGLPEQIKKTAEFTISHGDQRKSLPYDPQANCHPRHEVTLP